MNALWSLINLLVFIQIVTCRDFYLGMFRRNDFLVAQDVIYKAPAPFGYTTANYGRLFKCPITYFRVVDRLGMGRGPITSIVRGGLGKKFITVRIKSTYRHPVSVNIYVGCENKKPSTFRTTLSTELASTHTTTEEIEDNAGDDDDATTISGKDSDNATDSNDDAETGENEAATTDGSDTEDGSNTKSSEGGESPASTTEEGNTEETNTEETPEEPER